MKLDYIITGMPRSGTNYMAKLFTSAGIPCSHELIYGMPGQSFIPDKMMKAESSWMAAPYLRGFKGKIIHITRNPLKVISSLLAGNHLSGVFGENLYSIYKLLMVPDLYKFRDMDRYILFYITWNRLIEQSKPDYRFRLEDVTEDPKAIFKEMGINIKGKKLFNDVANKHYDEKDYIKDISEIDSKFIWQFKEQIRQYGY